MTYMDRRRSMAALSKDRLYKVGDDVPTIVADFKRNKYLLSGEFVSFDDMFTHTRSSSATYNDANGNFVTVGSNVPRVGHHVWDGNRYVDRGLLLNPVSVTNLLEHALGSSASWFSVGGATLSDLSLNALNLFPGLQVASAGATFHRAQAAAITLSAGDVRGVTVFYRGGSSGKARVTLLNVNTTNETTLSGALGLLSTTNSAAGGFDIISQKALPDGTFVVTGVFTAAAAGGHRLSFGPNSSTSGETAVLLGAQVDSIGVPTQLIVSDGAATTRAADSLSIADTVLQANGLTGSVAAYSIAASGQFLYSDNDTFATVRPLRVSGGDASNFVSWQIDTAGALEGRLVQNQRQGGVDSFIAVAGVYDPNETQSFGLASRHTASAHQIAHQGAASSAATPNGLPSPSASAMAFFDLGAECTVDKIRVWPVDIGQSGIEEASNV